MCVVKGNGTYNYHCAVSFKFLCLSRHLRNTLCGQNAELLNVKLEVHIVTTGLQRVKSLL